MDEQEDLPEIGEKCDCPPECKDKDPHWHSKASDGSVWKHKEMTF